MDIKEKKVVLAKLYEGNANCKLPFNKHFFKLQSLSVYHKGRYLIIEPPHDKTNKIAFVPSKDSDQPGHPPSLIRVFAVCSKDPSFLHADSEEAAQFC